MKHPVSLAASSLAAAALAVLAMTSPATAAIPFPPQAQLPSHFAAPYVDVTAESNLATVSRESGSRYLTLAFLQTAAPGSCTVDWAGNPQTPVSPATFGAQIAQIQRSGGNVIPSFGGYTADTTDTEIADSCTSVPRIAAAYEHVITTYNVSRLDFDVEADSLTDQAGIDRRNQAIHLVEEWAAFTGRHVSFSYTMPSTPEGLGATGVAVLQSAAKYGAYISSVDLMTFDYWDGATHDMLTDAESAATDALAQLQQTIAPREPESELWGRVGIVQMNGIDDYGPQETFTVAEAGPLVQWALQHHLGELSFWALQRDNGGCPGTKGAATCSGVVQSPWAFSQAFARFDPAW